MKMLGDDKSIRSSLTVKEVVGKLSADYISKTIQEKCGAGHLRVDASSKTICGRGNASRSFADTWNRIAGSFAISEDTKPRVINLDFPPLSPSGDRTQELIENGVEKGHCSTMQFAD